MFGKALLKELGIYARRLWPFILAIILSAFIAFLVVKYDNNPYELNGTIAGMAVFVISSIASLIAIFVFGIKQYSRVSQKRQLTLSNFIAKILASSLIYIFDLLLISGSVFFIWKLNIKNIIGSVFTEWYYIIEFIAYLFIVIPLIYLVPISLKNMKKYRGNKTLKTLFFILLILCLIFLLPLIECEVLLLAHLPNTDMSLLWITMCCLLSFSTLVDTLCIIFNCKIITLR